MRRKGKYLTNNVLMACLSNALRSKKDIHAQLAETIAERRKIIEQWESSSLSKVSTKNIHAQLRETIDELKMIMRRSGKILSTTHTYGSLIQDKSAA